MAPTCLQWQIPDGAHNLAAWNIKLPVWCGNINQPAVSALFGGHRACSEVQLPRFNISWVRFSANLEEQLWTSLSKKSLKPRRVLGVEVRGAGALAVVAAVEGEAEVAARGDSE